MKKARLLLVGSISLLMIGCAVDESRVGDTSSARKNSVDFRHAIWGMNKEQVKEVEKNAVPVPDSSQDKLVYDGNLLGRLKTRITYHFKDEKLIRGTYNFTPPLTLLEYKVLGRILAKKYGRPHSVGATHTMKEITWLTPKTETDLLGQGADFEEMEVDEPQSVKAIELTAIEINYYDRAWYAADLKRYEKAERETNETDKLYHQLVGAWVELPWYNEWNHTWGNEWDEGWARYYYYDL